jgi:hypothetical protein
MNPISDEDLATLDRLAINARPTEDIMRDIIDATGGFYSADGAFILDLINKYASVRERLRVAEDRLAAQLYSDKYYP